MNDKAKKVQNERELKKIDSIENTINKMLKLKS